LAVMIQVPLQGKAEKAAADPAQPWDHVGMKIV
jgi:hypothetical protein